MFKTFDLIILGIILASISTTYSIKHKVENKKEELRILENKIVLEQNYIDLLKAQWALLVQPDRIKDLVALYQKELQLQPTIISNLIAYDDLAHLKKKQSFSENRSDFSLKKVKIRKYYQKVVQKK
ncbi:hypothetical protein HUT03_05255 [Candidatus Liberibacter africanus]|uniref:Cell division protein FtsL n=1 Tax=Candidatus Liberibacter africanus PTSAPSY TaxID=1277257 RepID=A0A0G3I5U9_LIBAF|nr:hypothetical protein [Candidatus Liberibacter africanus]AKK20645.1 hypothetical protein G293_05170 [Candidatus Liberibacter africanus PTSAPSY]QTP64322.1 hypothetical protein HUT03_05255 [Candidatus Liberibacter africanus]